MDKLKSMEVFVAAVDAGSFAGAAERCAMSAVMVGKHIRQLESLLGASLLTRTTRRQALTEIGRQYAAQCRQILAQIDMAESVAESMRVAPRGLLRVTAPVSFGAQWLSPAVTDYLARWPDVAVELNLNDRLVDMVEEGFDVALRVGPLPDSGLVARPLRPYGMTICAAPAYLARHGTPRTPADLAAHECLEFTGWDQQTRWRLLGEKDGRHVRPGRIRANNTQALRMAALAGFGIVMQAETILRPDIEAGLLVPLLQDYLPAPRPMHVLYSRDRQATPKLTTFVEFLLERFGP
ncbi:LysR family transcriptional regulator [Pseudoduganella chitinolytica]|uniref:LysR family transcriptional regulator n=1 Tax=Pseudoduganella chitinolytica TaxID=34070 RepID=A0ABY8BAZ8_9BURK|nr:LysR family transcriptional regulator [Pseudoduganella chitinolytica]WEF33087.1 LysR family transcriptional regulator [Pseudoduganella chitinolytica]